MTPIRVLHVLRAMNRGGIETWLLHVLRYIDKKKFQMDFLVETNHPAAYDSEVMELGARIFHCPGPHNPILYGRRFMEITKSFGPFHVLHSHVHHYSGYVLWLGRQAGIPIRISHSHNDTSMLPRSLPRKAYLALMERLIDANATHLLAASSSAAADLFGPRWQHDPRVQVLFCGIDLEPFRRPVDRTSARSEFGFRPNDVSRAE